MRIRIIKYSIWFFLIPLLVVGGCILFHDKQYAWISLCVVFASIVPFILSFERGENNTKKIVLIAVMTAISVLGRILFAPLPGFKPVSAIVILVAIYMGGETGFMTGAMSAVVSNFYFGQGPWTPFQMLVWGFIGLGAGALGKWLQKNRIFLYAYGIVSGVSFSLLMDVWTVLWWDGRFNLSRYGAAVLSALPFMSVYAVSNVVFLALTAGPIGKKLGRIKTKYGL